MNTQNWTPGKIMELSGYYWKTCVLHAAVKLDIFTVIGDRALSGEMIAKQIKADVDGTIRLLNALVAMAFLHKKNGNFLNSDITNKFLAKDSDSYLGFMILHHHHLVDSWSKLDEAVRTGKPVRTRASFTDDTKREAFLLGMYNNAMLLAPRLVQEIDLTNTHNLLDMGGGPGTFAIHFCLKNPNLKAIVYDLPTTRPFAEKIIDQFGLKDRISFMDGNYVEEQLKGRYDVVWMSHILHGEGPETCHKMVQKAIKVLEPGGLIIIHEFILDNTKDSPLFPALFSMNMLLGTHGGRSYSEQEIIEMLKSAGVSDIHRSPFRGPTDSGIIIGKK